MNITLPDDQQGNRQDVPLTEFGAVNQKSGADSEEEFDGIENPSYENEPVVGIPSPCPKIQINDDDDDDDLIAPKVIDDIHPSISNDNFILGTHEQDHSILTDSDNAHVTYDALENPTIDIEDIDTFSETEQNSRVLLDNHVDSTSRVGDPRETPNHVGRKKTRGKGHWDVFRESPADNFSGRGIEIWKTVGKIAKIMTCFIIFLVVLCTAVISKLTLLLMTSNIFPPVNNQSFPIKTAHGQLTYRTTMTDVRWIWAVMIVTFMPYFFTIVKSVRRLCFKRNNSMDLSTLGIVLLVETVHSLGMALAVFVVLPNLDPISGALFCFGISIGPSILRILFPDRKEDTSTSELSGSVFLNAFGVVVGIGSMIVWCYYFNVFEESRRVSIMAIAIITPLLISVSWWENFVREEEKTELSGLPKLKRNVRLAKTKYDLVGTIWKCVLLLLTPILIFGVDCENATDCIDVLYFQGIDNATLYSRIADTILVSDTTFGGCSFDLPFIIAAINVASSIICYKTAKTAIKIVAQRMTFSLPLTLATPVTVGILVGLYNGTITIKATGCVLPFPVLTSPDVLNQDFEDHWPIIAAGCAGFVAMVIAVRYIWLPTNRRWFTTEMMFVRPLYCGIMLDLSMMLNRRKDEIELKMATEPRKASKIPLPENVSWNPDDWSHLREDDTPMIYMCATMWHENENEMTQILKSIVRMDEDQCTRRRMELILGIRDPDYYEFEAHIFFDDAFDPHTDDEYEYHVNDYVKQLVRIVSVSASSVYKVTMAIPPPTKIPTPYGGQLLWHLPGGNKMVAHLKDKVKIRHRKRWSQVMYMYYFLGHKLLNLGGDRRKIDTIARNTFLLALDGDVDFQPSAVQLLVDRMKKNPLVGAACGRIHPIGSGPMVWYQKFEYAVSHWLQKATEHMIGCVLCSPGCFSLFRGSALMDVNVMRRYTTAPTEARHYVQYDQGEDRWLCTLLLQQGYRVEYCAASDALTYAPEGFYEFYNQRRRWTPSTMANILDLLSDWRNVTRKNEDISWIYIAYHMFLMASSILTPGTIFLLILGAINTAWGGLGLWGALLVNLIPVMIMILLCFVGRSEIQLAYAAILSVAYSLVMMLVFVGLMLEVSEAGACSVTSVFLILVAGVFVFSALIHPQEFSCIIHGFLYFLAIPSMSMLLMIYSLGNLHVVSWGTRETNKPVATAPTGDPKPKTKLASVQQWLEKVGLNATEDATSDYAFSFGNLFRCICCPSSSTEKRDTELKIVLDRLENLEHRLVVPNTSSMLSVEDEHESGGQVQRKIRFADDPLLYDNSLFDENHASNPLFDEDKQKPRDELVDPYWALEKSLPGGNLELLNQKEKEFWEEFIPKYLEPFEKDKEKQAEMEKSLLQLRNRVCLFFLLINAIFVILISTLQFVTGSVDSLTFPLPCADEEPRAGQSVEPISVAFTVMFGVLLIIQFVCMLFHRLGTFLHILASTTIFKFKSTRLQDSKTDDTVTDSDVDDGMAFIKSLQEFTDDDTVSMKSRASDGSLGADDGDQESDPKRTGRYLWNRIGKDKVKTADVNRNFNRNLEKLAKSMKEIEQNSELENSEATDVVDPLHRLRQTTFKLMTKKSFNIVANLAMDKQWRDEVVAREARIKQAKDHWVNLREKFIKLPKIKETINVRSVVDAFRQKKVDYRPVEKIEVRADVINENVNNDISDEALNHIAVGEETNDVNESFQNEKNRTVADNQHNVDKSAANDEKVYL
ncbi:hypothetical protein ScPMuIL_017081 [Solemya velum]